MKLPKLTNIEYDVIINSRKFRISSEKVKYFKGDYEIYIEGMIKLEQVIGKKYVKIWKGTFSNPFKFEKEKKEKRKTLCYISGEWNDHFQDPIKFSAENFDKFYNIIKRNCIKYGRSFPSKKYSEIFFGELFNHYKKIYDKFLK